MWLFFVLVIYSVWKCFFGPEEEEDDDDQLVEGLEDYHDALKPYDLDVAIGQEETMRSTYRVKTMSDDVLYNLKNSKEDKDQEKIIMGVATYKILESMAYQQKFQYEPSIR
jgi:hypothetical protein